MTSRLKVLTADESDDRGWLEHVHYVSELEALAARTDVPDGNKVYGMCAVALSIVARSMTYPQIAAWLRDEAAHFDDGAPTHPAPQGTSCRFFVDRLRIFDPGRAPAHRAPGANDAT